MSCNSWASKRLWAKIAGLFGCSGATFVVWVGGVAIVLTANKEPMKVTAPNAIRFMDGLVILLIIVYSILRFKIPEIMLGSETGFFRKTRFL